MSTTAAGGGGRECEKAPRSPYGERIASADGGYRKLGSRRLTISINNTASTVKTKNNFISRCSAVW